VAGRKGNWMPGMCYSLTLLGAWQEGQGNWHVKNLAPAIPKGSSLEDLQGSG